MANTSYNQMRTQHKAAGMQSKLLAPFTPLDVTGLTFWLDAADPATITVDGSNNVSQWNDKSGNAKHATQATVLVRPALQASQRNGYPGVKFTAASGHFMAGTAFTGTEPFSLFCVVRKDGAGTGLGAHHINFNPGGSVFGLAVNTNPNTGFGGLIDMTAWRNDATTISNTTFLRQSATKNAGVHVYYRTGGITFTNNVPSTSATPVTNYELGRHSASAYADATIFEALMYSRLVTAGERNAIHAYLDAKWSI